MYACHSCGGEIIFRNNSNGVPYSIHLSGACGASGNSVYQTEQSIPQNECRGTNCPICGAPVFFVRYNGGSAWFDELGWPWPKHACFCDEPEPPWYPFVKGYEYNESKSGTPPVIATIKRAHRDKVGILHLAIDGGSDKRLLVTIEQCNVVFVPRTPVIIDWQKRSFFTLDGETIVKIKKSPRAPRFFGLNKNWLKNSIFYKS